MNNAFIDSYHFGLYFFFQTSDTKTSPLALLAATCSSIGKTESDKGRETNPKTTSPKVSSRSDDPKSSFKPYKQELGKMVSNSVPKLPGQSDGVFYSTAPTSNSNLSLFCHGRYPGSLSQADVEKERLNCGSSFFDGNRDLHPGMANMKCHTTPTLAPLKPHLSVPHHHPHEHECTQCVAMRAASETSMSQNASVVAAAAAAAAARNSAVCPCGYCAQMRSPNEVHPKANGQFCQYQSSGSVYPNFKVGLPTASGCRDPHCTNCTKMSQPSAGLQNYIHPALLHQCTHGKGVPSSFPGVVNTSLHSSLIPENFMKSSTNSTSQPFICNWVSDNKHCGKSFASSEELLQHLRTHTSLNQNSNAQRQSPCNTGHESAPGALTSQIPSQCNIHGCPCKLSSSASRPNPIGGSYSPYVSSTSALRYHPYGRIPTLPGSSSAYAHSYLPHSLLHY